MKQVPVVVDFETEAIQGRPHYPPKSVGVSVLAPGKKARYYAWGHPTKNNCTKEQATAVLRPLWKEAQRDGGRPMLFHNAKFDLDVAEVHHGLKLPPASGFHDTLFTLFLFDPHSRSLSLKPAAAKYLNMPPDERDDVRDWLITHGKTKNTKKDPWGAHIAEAPGDIVGAYANGDVIRTLKLHDKLYKEVVDKMDMQRSYDRERRLLLPLLHNEREGMRVNVSALARDAKLYRAAQAKVDAWIRKELKTPGLNVGSNDELANALTKARIVTEWKRTEPTDRFPEGQRSTSKKNMTVDIFNDVRKKKVKHPLNGHPLPFSPMHAALGYRNRLDTALGTFMENWLEIADKDGYIHTTWNQVRQDHGDHDMGGARTSRLSSYPPFLNLPKDWYDKNDGYLHPYHIDVPELPLIRKYVLPDKDEKLGHVDYSQQEYRLIAHFEDGALCAAYNENPYMDFHRTVGEWILDASGKELERRVIKICNFLDAYGGGVGKLALMVGCTVEEAKQIKAAKRAALPDVAALERGIKHLARAGEGIRTWGGSLLFCEQPRMNDQGHMQTFEYKMLNYLIQRSAAEMTKEAIIAYHHHPKRKGRFLVAVHDELNNSAGDQKRELPILIECMTSQKCDVPMITGDYDAKKRVHTPAEYGNNWAELKPILQRKVK